MRAQHERNAEIWRAYVDGEGQASIGKRYGITQQTVSEIIVKWRESIPQETREERALREIAFLDEVRVEAMKVARMTPAPVTVGKDGDILRDPEHKDPETREGVVVRDYSGRLAAMSLGVTVSTHMRKLLGLDAPTRTEITGGVKHELVGVDPEDLV
jgi:hypothetical protein